MAEAEEAPGAAVTAAWAAAAIEAVVMAALVVGVAASAAGWLAEPSVGGRAAREAVATPAVRRLAR